VAIQYTSNAYKKTPHKLKRCQRGVGGQDSRQCRNIADQVAAKTVGPIKTVSNAYTHKKKPKKNNEKTKANSSVVSAVLVARIVDNAKTSLILLPRRLLGQSKL
jgi:hypothetical protein